MLDFVSAMKDFVPTPLEPILDGLTMFLAISFFGHYVDNILTDPTRRKSVCDLLHRINRNSWPEHFLHVHDIVFLPTPKGRPRVSRSLIVSFMTLLVVFLAWVFSDFANTTSSLEGLAIVFILYALSFNMLMDFVSHWETRIIIVLMAKTKRAWIRVLFLLLDVVASIMIFLVGLVLGTLIFVAVLVLLGGSSLDDTYIGTVSMTVQEVFFSYGWIFLDDSGLNFFGVFFITTFFTSIWIWAFLLGVSLWPFIIWLKSAQDPKAHPYRVVMTIGGVCIGLAVALSQYFIMLWRFVV